MTDDELRRAAKTAAQFEHRRTTQEPLPQPWTTADGRVLKTWADLHAFGQEGEAYAVKLEQALALIKEVRQGSAVRASVDMRDDLSWAAGHIHTTIQRLRGEA